MGVVQYNKDSLRPSRIVISFRFLNDATGKNALLETTSRKFRPLIDTGTMVIPVEIKASERVTLNVA